jgi:hypothetical protein
MCSTDIEAFDHGSLGQIGVRQQNATVTGVSCCNGHRKRTPDRPQVSLEPDLTKHGVISQRLLRDLTAGHQDAKRDGQVKRRAVFSDIRRGKVDGDSPQRK